MKNSNLLGCILAPLALAVLVGIGGAVLYFVMNEGEYREELTRPGYAPTGGIYGWNGEVPFECGGNDAVTLTGVTSNLTTGPAVRAAANCRLTLEDCSITAPIAIEASGNAHVIVQGGTLSGATQSIVASGNARVTVNGAQVTGPVSRSGLAQVHGVP